MYLMQGDLKKELWLYNSIYIYLQDDDLNGCLNVEHL